MGAIVRVHFRVQLVILATHSGTYRTRQERADADPLWWDPFVPLAHAPSLAPGRSRTIHRAKSPYPPPPERCSPDSLYPKSPRMLSLPHSAASCHHLHATSMLYRWRGRCKLRSPDWPRTIRGWEGPVARVQGACASAIEIALMAWTVSTSTVCYILCEYYSDDRVLLLYCRENGIVMYGSHRFVSAAVSRDSLVTGDVGVIQSLQ
jgi:hypothetical protein